MILFAIVYQKWIFTFLLPFFEAFLEIKIALQKFFLREKLILLKMQVLEAYLYFKKYSNEKPQKPNFFIHHF